MTIESVIPIRCTETESSVSVVVQWGLFGRLHKENKDNKNKTGRSDQAQNFLQLGFLQLLPRMFDVPHIGQYTTMYVFCGCVTLAAPYLTLS